MIRLVRPAPELKAQALAFRQEFFDAGETVINGSEMFDHTEQYEEWLNAVTENTSAETVSPDWVVTDTFFALDDTDGIVGIIDFRHTLNGFLKDFGHCGYSVRPSERRKGYATEMLRLLLNHARQNGLREMQLSVERDNAPSVRTIVKNGGIYERSFEFEGNPADVYKIRLDILERITPAESKPLWEMQKAAFMDLLKRYQDYDTSPAAEPESRITERLEQPFTSYYWIIENGKKAGAIRVVDMQDGTRKRISPIFILPEFRGRKLAQRAICAAETLHGADHWALETILQEPENCHLYEKMGYHRTGQTLVINGRMTLVYYEK